MALSSSICGTLFNEVMSVPREKWFRVTSMESTEFNKLNVVLRCSSSQSLYYASVYYTLNDRGLSEVSDLGRGWAWMFRPRIGGWGVSRCAPPSMAGSGI